MAFPPVCVTPAQFRLTAVSNAHREMSPYSFKQTPYDFMGGMWKASLDLYSMKARDRATFLRWLVSLEGTLKHFELLALDYDGPFGTLTVNPTIAVAADVRARTVTVTLSPGETMTADDQITIDGHLHIVTSAAAKVGDTQAITIWPRLRSAVTVGQAVEALAPFGTWVLADPENGFSLSRRFLMTTTLELIEKI